MRLNILLLSVGIQETVTYSKNSFPESFYLDYFLLTNTGNITTLLLLFFNVTNRGDCSSVVFSHVTFHICPVFAMRTFRIKEKFIR